MARPRVPEARFDFRAGVNSTFSEDVLASTEVRRAENARLGLDAGITRRKGGAALGLATDSRPAAMIQWDAPGGRQLVVGTTLGELYTWRDGVGAPAPALAHEIRSFAPFRMGAAIVLFVADGASVYQYDGGDVVTSSVGAPAARWLVPYKGRMFALDNTKTLHWSRLRNPLLWGALNDGGSADVETFDTEPLRAAIVCGSSLLLFKRNNIARFTGVSAADIQIDTETEGVSNEVGIAAPRTLVAFEAEFFFCSDKGPYIGNAAAIEYVGAKIEAEWERVSRFALERACAAHHADRGEIWLALPMDGAPFPNEVWAYNYRTRAWYGPWPMAADVLAAFTRADGTETVARMGEGISPSAPDFFALAEEDTGSMDVAGDASVAIPLAVELPALFFGSPGNVKAMAGLSQGISADLGDGGSLAVEWESERGSGGVVIPSKGAGLRDYEFRLAARGKRLRFTLRSSTVKQITGATLVATVEGS